MNYLKQYIKLIRRAENRPTLLGYVERHHTFPKSLFGKNNRIVELTAREHYLAHVLLEKIYIKRYGMKDSRTHKMIRASFMMNNATSKGQSRYKNSRLYESNKLRFRESITGENNPLWGKKRIFTEQHLINLRAAHKSGNDNPLYGKIRSEEVIERIRASKQQISQETRDRIRMARRGMKFTEEHRINLSISHKGFKPTEETRLKMSLSQKGKPKTTRRRSKYILEITDPYGKTETVLDIRAYCERHGMPKAMDAIRWIARGKKSGNMYKGYKIRLISVHGGDE